MRLKNGLSSIYLNRTPISNSAVQSSSLGRDAVIYLNANGTSIMLGYGSTGISGVFPMLLKGAGKVGSASITSGGTTVTTAGSFFTSDMLASNSAGDGGLYQKIRIGGAGPGGAELEAEITAIISPTQAVLNRPASNTVTSAVITWDHFTYANELAIFGTSSVTLQSAVPRTDLWNNPAAAQSTWVPVLATIGNGSYGIDSANTGLNFKNVKVNFRPGTLDQAPIQNTSGFTSASSGVSPGTTISQIVSIDNGGSTVTVHNSKIKTFWGGEGNATDIKPTVPSSQGTVVISGVGSNGLNLANPSEVDEIAIAIAFPNGLNAFKPSDNSYGDSGCVFQIYFEYKMASAADYQKKLIFGPSPSVVAQAQGYFVHTSGTLSRGQTNSGTVMSRNNSSFSYEFKFSVDEFKPFDDFRIRIIKITPDSFKANGWNHTCDSTLSYVQAFISDKLNYPYSSYLALEFNSQEFQGQYPDISAHCYGVEQNLPVNYVTREEAADGVAKYTRNGSGTITTSYVPWNGSFRRGYSNNPIWNVRELLVNKRWGLGTWITEDQINDYALYSLARYCDELVPDGEGGLEPRFTVFAYLTQSTEAYKVIKDFFTTMLAIPYWVDGQLTPIGDKPGNPVYTFSKANIENGIFSYEGTGNKVRPNQVAVTYNDKDYFYEQRVEIVDDIDNIIETNRIITEEVVAFGATSRGQATRYGRWKMLTGKMTKEIVSFKTGDAAIFLKPGDIINIQDADRHRVRYSGRVSAATTTSITVDSPVTLETGETYSLYAVIPGPACYLAQKSAVISSVTYNFGDQLPIFTPEDAQDLTDDDGEIVNVQFQPDMHLEHRTVTNSPGVNQTVLNVSAAFSAAPNREFMWGLVALNSAGAVISGSPKAYRILAITEESPGVYGILASEHYNSKFDLINEDYLLEPTGDAPRYGDIPAPRDFTAGVQITQGGSDSTNSAIVPRIILSWRRPVQIVSGVEQEVTNLDSYILKYQAPDGAQVELSIPSSSTSYVINNPPLGAYSFSLQSRSNLGPVSRPRFADVLVQLDNTTPGLAAQLKLLRGGQFSRPPLIIADEVNSPVDYDYISPLGTQVRIRSGIIA